MTGIALPRPTLKNVWLGFLGHIIEVIIQSYLSFIFPLFSTRLLSHPKSLSQMLHSTLKVRWKLIKCDIISIWYQSQCILWYLLWWYSMTWQPLSTSWWIGCYPPQSCSPIPWLQRLEGKLLLVTVYFPSTNLLQWVILFYSPVPMLTLPWERIISLRIHLELLTKDLHNSRVYTAVPTLLWGVQHHLLYSTSLERSDPW